MALLYFPYEIKERIINFLAHASPVLTIALGMTNHEFHDYVVAKYRAQIRVKNSHFNHLAADLFNLKCWKLSIYFARYNRTDSSGLGGIYPAILGQGSPQIVDTFIRGIIPKYVQSWPAFSGVGYVSMANLKVIKRRCDELGYQINTTTLNNIVRVGCSKAANWALTQLMNNVYDQDLAFMLLKRGETKLIRRLMAVNMDLFLGEGAISAALKGNCEREIFDLLYGLGASTSDCHTIDKAINEIKSVDVLKCVLDYSGGLHNHTERKIIESGNVDFMALVLSNTKMSCDVLNCNATTINKILDTPILSCELCNRVIGSTEMMKRAITVFTIDQLGRLFDCLKSHFMPSYTFMRRNPDYIGMLAKNAKEAGITDKTKSKIWLLYTQRFTLPRDIIKLMHEYDSLMIAIIACQHYEIAPLNLLVAAKVGSKIRAYYSDICSKLTPLLATSGTIV